MAKKKINSSTSENTQKKIVTYKDYLSTFNWKRTPYSDDMLQQVALDYLQWAQSSPDALVLDEFPQSRGFQLMTWYRWIKDNDHLNVAHKEAKRIVGTRREKLAFLNKANASIFMASAPHYDYSDTDYNWMDLLRMKAELSNKEETRPTITVVEIPTFSKTPEEVAMAVREKTRKITKMHYNDRNRDKDELTARGGGTVHKDAVIEKEVDSEDED
jgi:hypothetical protein